MIDTRSALLTAAVALFAAAAVQQAGAQDDGRYPSKPIRIIVGFAAGGGNDLFARLIAPKLSEHLGQNVIVENKPGAGGRLAVEFVRGQPADRHTLMVAPSGAMAVAAAIYPSSAITRRGISCHSP